MHHLVEIAIAGRDLELLSDDAWVAGAVGVEERGANLVVAFTDASAAATAARRLGGALTSVDDHHGLDEWRHHARAVAAGPFVVRPPWLAASSGTDLVIDPGHAFGSGSHPSTRLALAALAAEITSPSRVVDLGAGSGVLSIAAALCGADVVAIDHDPAAAAAVEANADHNGVADRVRFELGDAALAEVVADLILCNVTIDLHEQIGPAVGTTTGAPVLVAGLLAGEHEERCARAWGRAISRRWVEDEWVALRLDHGAATSGF